jgi:oligopeptide/dipeptide ABC transporter ATP-binding protein
MTILEGSMPPAGPLLDLQGLRVHHPIRSGLLRRPIGHVRAVDGVSLSVAPGETLGLVGESGSGKSTLARAILRLTPITDGRIAFQGRDLTRLGGRSLREARRYIQPVFQDTHGSLNPSFSVYQSIAEPLIVFGIHRGPALHRAVSELLVQVGLTPAFGDRRPAELSGGQRQRVGIARALALRPQLIIADEPVSALDVSIQSQIINLLQDLQEASGLTYLFISHDLAVVRHIANRVAVMYLGRLMELGDADGLFEDPLHPYTQALLAADQFPSEHPRSNRTSRSAGRMLAVEAPSAVTPPSGCVYRTRCLLADAACAETVPALELKATGRWAACIKIPSAPGATPDPPAAPKG